MWWLYAGHRLTRAKLDLPGCDQGITCDFLSTVRLALEHRVGDRNRVTSPRRVHISKNNIVRGVLIERHSINIIKAQNLNASLDSSLIVRVTGLTGVLAADGGLLWVFGFWGARFISLGFGLRLAGRTLLRSNSRERYKNDINSPRLFQINPPDLSAFFDIIENDQLTFTVLHPNCHAITV